MALVNATESRNPTVKTAVTASTQLVAANPERSALSVAIDPAIAATVYILLGTGTASAANFDYALNANTPTWNGLIGNTVWRGAVQAFSTLSTTVVAAEVAS